MRISIARFELGVGARKKDKTGQEKVTKGLYFTYLWRSPHWSDVHEKLFNRRRFDVITCAKFQNKIFRGCDFTGGRIFHFPIDNDLWLGLTTVQRYCAACDQYYPWRLQSSAQASLCLSVCLSVFSHSVLKTNAARITKPDIEMFHDESWKSIYLGVKRSRSRDTRNSAGVGWCIPVSAIASSSYITSLFIFLLF